MEAAVGVCQYFDLRQEIPLPRKHDLQYATTSHAFMEHHAALMLPRHVAPLIPQADLRNVWGKRQGHRLWHWASSCSPPLVHHSLSCCVAAGTRCITLINHSAFTRVFQDVRKEAEHVKVNDRGQSIPETSFW